MARITVTKNGPYIIYGEADEVVDWTGNTYKLKGRPIALCRCGGSRTKPFCDGSHSKIQFQASESAVPADPNMPKS